MNPGEKKLDWFKKGATLSDKSARKDFGITQEEIYKAINDGKLHYHVSDVYGNPYFKLLRSEVEAFVTEKYGKDYVEKKKIEKELAQINKELKKLKTQIDTFEQKRVELLERLNNISGKG
ncbi:MAG: hypothetical protein WBD09_00335 [Halobacteriota archaeon]